MGSRFDGSKASYLPIRPCNTLDSRCLSICSTCALRTYICYGPRCTQNESIRPVTSAATMFELGKSLLLPLIQICNRDGFQQNILRAIAAVTGDHDGPPPVAAIAASPQGRCAICGRKRDRKVTDKCHLSNRFVCSLNSESTKLVECVQCRTLLKRKLVWKFHMLTGIDFVLINCSISNYEIISSRLGSNLFPGLFDCFDFVFIIIINN